MWVRGLNDITKEVRIGKEKRGPCPWHLLVLEKKRNQQKKTEKEEPVEEAQENVRILETKRKCFKLERTINCDKRF